MSRIHLACFGRRRGEALNEQSPMDALDNRLIFGPDAAEVGHEVL